MLYNNLERLVSAACVDIKHVDALGEVAYIDYIAHWSGVHIAHYPALKVNKDIQYLLIFNF